MESNLRCIHRHTEREHPRCFVNGVPLQSAIKQTKTPKILLFDIETAPMTVMVWNLNSQYISSENILSDYFVLSWSAKWLFNKKIYSDVLTSAEVKEQNDSRILQEIWNLLDEADIVIAHNGKSFDTKSLNTRFIANDMKPPKPYLVIDTLTAARSNFRFSSNKLDYINKYLGLDTKLDHAGLWKKCFFGDPRSLVEMQLYNRNDVVILEELYTLIRPWISNHPNLPMYMDFEETRCPVCCSTNVEECGHITTRTNVHPAIRCKDCGTVGHLKVSLVSKKTKSVLASK